MTVRKNKDVFKNQQGNRNPNKTVENNFTIFLHPNFQTLSKQT